ncbi:DNA topoisomerase 2-like isoform X2 [Camellia sinensis]|nr:DNA topoisomerase 2-like isoform X2 [Camellia sinensis]XP_028069782.1 DNA topoisomerase 2-like isoform X2 [Camellia sinensis]XP_028069783.1 DNA topoisomerase 2-like isoform X2 [Camellia sinensis]
MGPNLMHVEDFLVNGLPLPDKGIQERVERASSNGNVLRYVCVIEDSRAVVMWVDEQDGEAIELAFSKKKIEARKNWLRQFEPGAYLDQKEKLIKYSDFVNKELILFSRMFFCCFMLYLAIFFVGKVKLIMFSLCVCLFLYLVGKLL